MFKVFMLHAITAFVFLSSCIILVQSNYVAQQPAITKTSTGFSESTPYIPRIFENADKTKKRKKKKDEPQENLQTTQSLREKLPADTIITLPVSVFDTHLRFIKGLQKSDFKLFVNDKECEVDAVETRDQPLNIILLLDTSPSAYLQNTDLQNYALAVVRSAAVSGQDDGGTVQRKNESND